MNAGSLDHHSLKVLFLSNIPAPYRILFFNELGKKCDLTVTFEGKSAKDRDKKWKYERIENFKAVFLRGIRTGADHFFCLSILPVLRRQWDMIIIGDYYTPTSMLAIEYMRIRHIGYWIEADGGLIKKDRKWVYWAKRHFLSGARGWFSSGRMTTRYLVHYGAQESKCYHFSFASLKKEDMSAPSTQEEKALRKIRKGICEDKMVFTVAQIIPRKGIDVLLTAAKRLEPDVGFYIAGGNPTAEMKRAIAGFPNIHFIGFKTKKELNDYYRAADVFVLPTREDIWGLVIGEAMAHGLPVVTTDRCVAGLELVIDGKNGRIVPAGNVQELADAVKESLNRENRDVWGTHSWNYIQKYTIEEMAEDHMKVFRMILTESA